MKRIFFVVSLTIGNYIFAQSFKMSQFPGTEVANASSIIYKEEMFSLSLDFKKGATNYIHAITIRKHGKDFGVVKSLQLSAGEKIYGPVKSFLKSVDNNLYLFYYKETGEDKMQLLVSKVNPENLQLSETVSLQDIQPNGKHMGFYNRSVTNDENNSLLKSFYGDGPKYLYKTFFFELSPDGSKVLLVWTTGWDNQVFYSILNKDMTKIRSGDIKLPGDDRVALGSSCIDNSGNSYLVYHYSNKKQDIAGLFAIDRSGKTNVNQIAIPEAEVSSAFARIKQGDDMIFLTGTYKQNSYNLSGVFKQQFDPAAGKAVNTEKTPFPADLVTILDDEGWASNKKNYGVTEEWVVEPFLLKDGTETLVGEFRSRIEGQKVNARTSGSILIARFNKTGTVFSRVPKLRVSAGTTYGDSYKIVEFKNKMIFFYSDHTANLNLDLSREPKRSDNYSNSVFVAATISETGGVERKIVVDLSKEDYLAENESMIQISPASYYVPFRRIKKMGGLTDDLKLFILSIE